MESKIENLIRSMEDLQNRIKTLEAQVQDIRQTQQWPLEEGEEEPWEVIEIRNLLDKWYNSAKQGVAVSASRDEQGWTISSTTIKELTTEISVDRVIFLLSPFSSEQRLKILLQLYEYPKSQTDLTNATGLQGGQLYHHLDELMEAHYIEKEYKGKYRLTDEGRSALYNALLIAQRPIRFPQMERQNEPEQKDIDASNQVDRR